MAHHLRSGKTLTGILIGYHQGKVRLVVDVESADIMATLLRLKAEVEHKFFTETNIHTKLRLTFSGATEAHVLARELRHAKVGVLVHPRPYPYTWELRRMCDFSLGFNLRPFDQIVGLSQCSRSSINPSRLCIVPRLPGH